MRTVHILLLMFLLGFGCIEDTKIDNLGNEVLLNSETHDLDNDGITDYAVYSYGEYMAGDMEIRRMITVSTITCASYTELNNITDLLIYNTDKNLDEFSKSRSQSDGICSQNLGIMDFVCSDITTCSRLCSTASSKCRAIAEAYDETLARSMMTYVQDNGRLRSLILDTRRMVKELKEGDMDEKSEFLSKTREMVSRIASINANPLYNYPELVLCEHSDFGVKYITQAAEMVGNYSTRPLSYEYTVIVSVKPKMKSDELEKEIISVTLIDNIPPFVDGEITTIHDTVKVSKQDSGVDVTWNSKMPSDAGYLISYEYSSQKAPEEMLSSVKKPEISATKLDMSVLAPTNAVLGIMMGATGNYYISLGVAAGLTVAALLVLYNLLILIFVLITERAAGATFTAGFRRAFGRTVVTWKSDIIIAMVFLAIGYYISSFHAELPEIMPTLLESVEFIIRSGIGMLGFGLVFIGIVFIYLTADNLGKITVLERAYGMVIRHEKDMYVAKAAKLKEKIGELESLINQYSKENFEFSREYDVLTSAKGIDVDKLMARITAQTKARMDDELASVEGSIKSLLEKRKLAEENWPRWQDSISKMLDEQNEVYSPSLITIPASLRTWALNKYASETEGVVLDHDGIKKKAVSAESIIHQMIVKEVLQGAIVIRQEKIVMSDFAEGSGTVKKALALKLRNYLKTIAKKLGQRDPQSFVAVGSSNVIVYMKGRISESVIFVDKNKFNEGVEQWKAKMPVIDR
ncbi:hypothetical protein JXA56_00610 [Candidatus Micrarchaeota archaeon]|nr:hypothetical protein [Candidatus Micrarchaeota archaeon]